jgi:hypothetical protein
LDAQLASGWSQEFAGTRILSGTLGARLDVQATGGQLSGRAEFWSREIETEASATGEPRSGFDPDLVQAVLQDDSGRIDIPVGLAAVPAESTETFLERMTDAVEQYLAIVNKQPLDFLASTLGVETAALTSIVFEPGEAGLRPGALDRLDWLKSTMQWRPGLAVTITGGFDPEADRYALAEQQIRLHVNLATAVSSGGRNESAPIRFADPKARVVIDEFAGSRLGRDRVNEIARRYQPNGDAGESELPSSYYRALYDALVENEQISQRALLSLARFRARTVIDQLQRSGIEPERLENGGSAPVRGSMTPGIPTTVEWSVHRTGPIETSDVSGFH